MSPYLSSLVGPAGVSSAAWAAAFAGAAISQSAATTLSHNTAFLRWDMGFIGTLLIGFCFGTPGLLNGRASRQKVSLSSGLLRMHSSAEKLPAAVRHPFTTAAVSSHSDCRVRHRKPFFRAFASISLPFHLEWMPSHELPHQTAARRPPDDFCVGLRRRLRGDPLHRFVFRSQGPAAHRRVGGAIQEGIYSKWGGALSPGQEYRRRRRHRPHGY